MQRSSASSEMRKRLGSHHTHVVGVREEEKWGLGVPLACVVEAERKSGRNF